MSRRINKCIIEFQYMCDGQSGKCSYYAASPAVRILSHNKQRIDVDVCRHNVGRRCTSVPANNDAKERYETFCKQV